MARQLPTLLGCLLALLLATASAVHAAPRVATAASAGRTFAAAARSVDAGGRLTVTGGPRLALGTDRSWGHLLPVPVEWCTAASLLQYPGTVHLDGRWTVFLSRAYRSNGRGSGPAPH